MATEEKKEQLYCVAARARSDGKRRPLTGGMSKMQATGECDAIKNARAWKNTHKYFHVAKFPYHSQWN